MRYPFPGPGDICVTGVLSNCPFRVKLEKQMAETLIGRVDFGIALKSRCQHPHPDQLSSWGWPSQICITV